MLSQGFNGHLRQGTSPTVFQLGRGGDVLQVKVGRGLANEWIPNLLKPESIEILGIGRGKAGGAVVGLSVIRRKRKRWLKSLISATRTLIGKVLT